MNDFLVAGSLLEAARVARGLTQSQLASQTGIAQGVISKLESGQLALDADRIEALARVLAVPRQLIDGTALASPHVRVFHRRQASLPAKVANRLRAELGLAHLRASRLLLAPPPLDVPRMPLASPLETPSDKARELRKQWGVPSGPIDNMVSLVESHGVPCLAWDVASARVDAIASWPPGTHPLILLGLHAPGDRLRFTVAHELGHAVMHDVPSGDQEREADEFAAEFLMPRLEVREILDGATLPSLMKLKETWGTSIAALARRARDVGAISDSSYRRLNIELSASGLRLREPVEIPREQPTLVRTAIAARLARGESLAAIAADAFIEPAELRHCFLEAA
mgnify:CR=1 FL=1